MLIRDLDKLNLKGSVQSAIIERRTSTGMTSQEMTFNTAGMLVGLVTSLDGVQQQRLAFRYGPDGIRLDLDIRVIRHPNGSYTYVQPVAGIKTWSLDGLRTVAFGTYDADLARTTFDTEGVPVETVFERTQGGEVSRIHYRCDDVGRVAEATQFSGRDYTHTLPPEITAAIGEMSAAQRREVCAFVDSGVEQFRASFKYDDHGYLLESECFWGGQRIVHRMMTYNEYGDVATSTTDDQPLIRHEYRYDDHLNWIWKRTFHAMGVDEEWRTLAYFL